MIGHTNEKYRTTNQSPWVFLWFISFASVPNFNLQSGQGCSCCCLLDFFTGEGDGSSLTQSATHLKILQYLYIISYFKPVGEFFFFFLGGLLSLSRGVVGVLVLAAGAFWGVAGVLVLGAGGAFFA